MKTQLLATFGLLVFVCFCNAKLENKNREGKLFSLFSVVNFKNDPCQSTSSISSGSTEYRNGTCYTSSECTDKGGSEKGGCAAGFGVCCVFILNKASSKDINQNDTYVQNPGFPSAFSTPTAMSYTVNKYQDDICFLRLDFETFTLDGPVDETAGGACPSGSFSVTVTGQSIPDVCGSNAGEHMYINMGPDRSSTATLQFSGFTTTSTSPKWEIKVSQIPCYKEYSPPDGCLQWNTGLTGKIRTFNYLSTTGSHLSSQDYRSCVRQEAGFCCIEYTVCDATADSFSLDNLATDISEAGATCNEDYIAIEGI
jgi:hypothetical protein